MIRSHNPLQLRIDALMDADAALLNATGYNMRREFFTISDLLALRSEADALDAHTRKV